MFWIICIWSKNSGNNPWGSCSPQKVFLLLLNYAPPASPFFPNFWTFFNNLEHRENFETLSSGLTLLVLEWEQKPTFLTQILDKISNSGKTLHVTGPSGKKIFFSPWKTKNFDILDFGVRPSIWPGHGIKDRQFWPFSPISLLEVVAKMAEIDCLWSCVLTIYLIAQQSPVYQKFWFFIGQKC